MSTTEQQLKRLSLSSTLLSCFEAYYKKLHRKLVTQYDTELETFWFSNPEEVLVNSVCWRDDGFSIFVILKESS